MQLLQSYQGVSKNNGELLRKIVTANLTLFHPLEWKSRGNSEEEQKIIKFLFLIFSSVFLCELDFFRHCGKSVKIL
ncbi:MAG: hypothetical protein Ta2B_02940 [Termitinemataceae bacterium]|nr:MAG: hypothetical protein Ta2B_02940 [Termitinemataceae bacterium]